MPPTSGTSLGTATGTVVINAQLTQAAQQITQFSQQTQQQMAAVAQSTVTTSQAFTQLAGAFGLSLGISGLKQVVQITADLATASAQAERTRQAYDDLAAGVDQDADQMLAAMQKASDGMINDANLVLVANQAMVLGVADSAEEMAQILEVARARGAAVGRSTSGAFKDIVEGIGRMSPEILDNLGIVIGGQQAFDEYARSIGRTADSLTAAEKKAFLLNRTLSESRQIVEDQAQRGKTAADSYEQAATAWDNYRQAVGDGINAVAGAMSLTEFFTATLNVQTETLKTNIALINAMAEQVQKLADALRGLVGIPAIGAGAAGGGGVPSWMTSVSPAAAGPLKSDEEIERLHKISAAWEDRFDKMADIQRQADADILSENTSYNQRRIDLNTNYNEQVAESAASFARQAGRAQEDYESSILAIMRDSQQQQQRMAEDHARQMARLERDHNARLQDLDEQLARETGRKRADSAEKIADMQDDLADDIAKRNIDSSKKLADIDEDYQRQRQQAARAHADTLSDAASRLDANAVFQEQRRFQREQDEAAKSHDEKVADEQDKLQESIDNLNASYEERLSDEQEALNKSINQANEAHDRAIGDENEAYEQQRSDANAAYALQLSDQQAAANARMQDLISAYGNEKTRRDEDQLDHLGQMKTHHDQDLAKLDTEHGLRITQIGTHAQDERNAYDAEFRKQLHDLGIHNDAYDKAEKQHQEQIKLGQAIFQEQEKRQLLDTQIAMLEILKLNPLLSATEIGVLQQALNLLGQRQVTADTNIYNLQRQLDALPANPYDFTALTPSSGTAGAQGIVGAAAMVPVAAGTVTNSSIGGNTVNASIVINGVSGQTANDLADIIDERLLTVFQQAAGYGSGR